MSTGSRPEADEPTGDGPPDFAREAAGWAARRALISAFVLVHLAAVLVWSLPDCAIRERFAGLAALYVLPLGLWEKWRLFAPDPTVEAVVVEAVVRDRDGLSRAYTFPRMAALPTGRAFWGYRYIKYAEVAGIDQHEPQRASTARFAVRRLGIPSDRFPVEVEVDQLVWMTPPPDSARPDPAAAPARRKLSSYRFASPGEVAP